MTTIRVAFTECESISFLLLLLSNARCDKSAKPPNALAPPCGQPQQRLQHSVG
ncbi:hypothetical protein IQ243_24325 [Nostocales cyanobacterium LEGE 11386]|nr:hypothetical protein [Nostocales cyanobacterium LEGE 11386]